MTANSQTHVIHVANHSNRNTQMSDVISKFFWLFFFWLFASSSPSAAALVLSARILSLLHYCFLCILIFTKCQSNDEKPEMKKAFEWKWEKERKTHERTHQTNKQTNRRKKQQQEYMCVICASERNVCGDIFEWYVDGISNRGIKGSDAFNFTWRKVHGFRVFRRTFNDDRRFFFLSFPHSFFSHCKICRYEDQFDINLLYYCYAVVDSRSAWRWKSNCITLEVYQMWISNEWNETTLECVGHENSSTTIGTLQRSTETKFQ